MSDSPLVTAYRLLSQAVDELSVAAGPGASEDELPCVLTLCEGLTRRLDRLTVATVSTLEQRGTLAERGYHSAVAALCDLLGWERFEARRRVVAAERVCQRVGLESALSGPGRHEARRAARARRTAAEPGTAVAPQRRRTPTAGNRCGSTGHRTCSSLGRGRGSAGPSSRDVGRARRGPTRSSSSARVEVARTGYDDCASASDLSKVDRIAEPWGARTPYGAGEQWPVRVDQHLADGVDPADVASWTRSASLLHSNGDALDLAVAGGRIVGVRGRADDRVNHGRLGPKDLFGWQANSSPDRLTRPLVRRHGELVETAWDTALDLVAARTRALLDEQGPSALGFYTTGQLFLEEYYTQAAIGHGALSCNHMDGNTRLCTATAAAALKESFACDGQPGSYTDVDHADVIALFGHNMAETQTVLWTRVLDRLAGPNPPTIVCVDPRDTPVAKAARARGGVHLANVPGTNVALMNGLLHEIVGNGWIDRDYIEAHTVGFPELAKRVAEYPPERVARICGVDPDEIRRTAQILGEAQRLLSTVLQGFYQSHQASAAAVQVNNVNLVRGMLGRPGCGILQMNGQPTAQNTRECGADGDMSGFRNWANDAHVADLARHWNLDPFQIPHAVPPTHAVQIFRYIEDRSIRFLWVTGTNPAVSLPELSRIRALLAEERLFLVVQDIFLSETAQLADVVLPAATQGEKTGCFTNVDRTVHLSDKAVDPPGEARPDLDIFLDYARRMDFRDLDGNPFPQWHDAESAFAAWAASTEGRPCDYTGLSHEKLRAAPSGIQWPCNEENPDGTERLYAGGTFWARPDYCESYGRDLVTGTPLEPTEYRALNPAGKAVLKAAEYLPPHERSDAEHPLVLVTGRTLYHFHTRTKTGRAPQLQAAAPEVWIECSAPDAQRLGLAEGDLAEVATPRGAVRGRVRISGIREGVVFVPFHYGYWDADAERCEGHDRAANELTATDWDPVSKQPLFKTAAARLTRVVAGNGQAAPAPTTTGSAPVTDGVSPTRGGPDAVSDQRLVPTGGAR